VSVGVVHDMLYNNLLTKVSFAPIVKHQGKTLETILILISSATK